MGGYAGKIGDYCIMMGDYVFDYIRESAPKEYFENKTIDVEFIHYLPGMDESMPWVVKRNQNREDIEIPLLKLGTLKKLKKYYRFTPDFNLRKILWEEIEKRSIIVEGYVGFGTHYGDEDGKTQWKYYYLTSRIGEEPIKLQSPTEGVNVLHEIRNYDEHIWIIKQGLEFFTEIRT